MTTIPSAPTSPGSPVRSVPGYLAVPVPTSDRPGPWPGVVLVHDVFGLGDDAKEQADWLAAAGYVVLAPDLFSGGPLLRCVRSAFRQLRTRRGPVFEEVEAARRWLLELPETTGRTGVVGYCLGGGFALLLAGEDRFDVAAVNYGQVPDDVDEVLAGSCPLVGSFGARDRSLPRAADRLTGALEVNGIDHDVHEYPRARHGFINRVAVRSPLSPLMAAGGVGHHHPSAADAKERILRFFDRHLRAADQPGPTPGPSPHLDEETTA